MDVSGPASDSGIAATPAIPGPGPILVSPVSAMMERPRLLSRLGASTTPVVILSAPSGYGKSVLLGQWAGQDPRPFETITLGDDHNDPAMLLASIVEALDRIEPVPREVTAALSNPQPSIEDVVLPRLARALASRQVPMVLVLDELEQIESPESLKVVSTIGANLARGSQLALATRVESALPLGRLRAHRRLTELGLVDLQMNRDECKALLEGLGLELGPKQLDTLVRRTEGWPAALYLAGLALNEEADLSKAISRFAGDDRIVVDYIREEFLVSVSQQQLGLLRRISILDRFNGSLCDAVLVRTGSANLIRDLSRSNILLMPLDRQDEWFRFHSLFADMLNSELRRVEPEDEAGLNRRASDWWADHGDWDRAVNHAIEGDATARVGELLWLGIPEYMTRGRKASFERWLDRIGEQTIASDAALSLTAACADLTSGAGGRAEHWTAVARTRVNEMEKSEEKNALTSGLGLVEAALAREGAEAMSSLSAAAAELLPDESSWLSMCCLIDGTGLYLRGFRGEGGEKLAEGARRGAVGAPNVQVLCLSQLALLAIERDDWQTAEMLASQARAQIERSGLGDYQIMALGLAVSAYVRSYTGKAERAAVDLRHGIRLLNELDDFAPWFEAETRIVMARAAARLNEVPTAAGLLDEATRLLKLTPDATVLGEWIDQTATTIESASTAAIRDLTPAELRVLDFLPTHLSFPEIAARVHVSPNTIKTQAQSVYRKLGVSSRREAVEDARVAGLLEGERASRESPVL